MTAHRLYVIKGESVCHGFLGKVERIEHVKPEAEGTALTDSSALRLGSGQAALGMTARFLKWAEWQNLLALGVRAGYHIGSYFI